MATRSKLAWAVWTLAPGLPLAAQAQATVPASLAFVEGGSGSSIPFGTAQPVRFQCIYDRHELPWSGPRAMGVVSLRADNDDPLVTAFAAKAWVTCNLVLSTSTVDSQSASTSFDANHGRDRVQVFGNVPILLPAQPAQAGVRAANIDFVLPAPWIYGLTPARPGEEVPDSLVIELQILSQPAGAYRIDNIGNCAVPPAPFGNVGPACAEVGLPPLELLPGATMIAGSAFSWQVRNAPANAPVVLLVDAAQQGFLFGLPSLPLPLPLFDPQDPSSQLPALLAAAPALVHPAPDCWLNVAPAATLFVTADAAGSARFTVTLAPGRQFVGQQLFAQAAAVSRTANPMQVITSGGMASTICGPLGVARLYAFGSATAPTGQLQRGQGAVVELR